MNKIEIDSRVINESPGGCYCTFIKIGERGLKCYRSEKARDDHYRNQKRLADKGLAPYVDERVDVTLSDGRERFAYWSGIAEVVCDIDKDDPRRKLQHRLSAFADLHEKLRDAGYNWVDDHDGNWGYINGRPVIIDTGGY